jgi:sulfhydrogenase subunit beta (sulfur reductase)
MERKMSNELVVHRDDFKGFLARLIEGYAVFGPSQDDGSDSIVRIEKPEQFRVQRGPSHFSFKHFFLPQIENLFSFDLNSKKIDTSSDDIDNCKPVLLIGLRPCDAMAVQLLDKVFMEREPKDVFYANRRDRTQIISFACSEPRSTCFCDSVGCQPDSEAGADIIIHELKNDYVVKPITQRGDELLKNTGMHLDEVSKQITAEKEQNMVEAREQLKKVFTIDDLDGKVIDFDASHWKQICQKCLGCGVCTYFCPTCHCFDIIDEVEDASGRRIRSWDSCMYPLFTLHASGHNPRPTRKERMRQRIMHKFVYAIKQYGRRFCVGCGRCVTQCPVNFDIRDVINEIMETK